MVKERIKSTFSTDDISLASSFKTLYEVTVEVDDELDTCYFACNNLCELNELIKSSKYTKIEVLGKVVVCERREDHADN